MVQYSSCSSDVFLHVINSTFKLKTVEFLSPVAIFDERTFFEKTKEKIIERRNEEKIAYLIFS